MKKDKALDVFLQFMEDEVLSKSGDLDFWLGALSLALFKPAILIKIKGYEPMMKLSGVLNDEDDIDLDKLNEALNYAFSKKPQLHVDFREYVPFLNFKSTFTQTDAAELMKRLHEAK